MVTFRNADLSAVVDRCIAQGAPIITEIPAAPVVVLPPVVVTEPSEVPHNAVTGAQYQGKNVLRLLVAEAEHEYGPGGWAGFHQWISVGRVVRKGEHGTRITQIGSSKVENADGSVTVKSHPVGGRPVFHFDQTTELKENQS